jgi:hypothetical protein
LPASKFAIVAFATLELVARRSCDHPINARAARHCADVINKMDQPYIKSVDYDYDISLYQKYKETAIGAI